MLQKLLQVGFCLNAWGEGLSLAEGAEIVEGERHWGGPEGDEGALEIHEQEDVLVVVGAADDDPLLVLCSFLDGPMFFLNEEIEVGGAPEVKSEAFDGAVGFVANEEVEEEIVVAGIEVIEGEDFAAELKLVVFEEDVLLFEALFLVF